MTSPQKSQIKRIVEVLEQTGKVQNYWALRNYITRLSAIIFILKEDGYQFDTKWEEGTKNYVYTLTGFSKTPKKYPFWGVVKYKK